ncbi:MAG: uncharacterized protein QOJ86_5011 [Bradyrhizobium sp.]|jgi:predicted DNA-binding protein with PD1-like motif|nr:uncharacterized protein [Bradyrhizobium sp.]
MEQVRESGGRIFVRLEQGEELIDSLKRVATDCDLSGYEIASGVGMIEGLRLGFFCVNDNDYAVSNIPGLLDLSSVSGNVFRREDQFWPHVHIVANRPDFSTVSGHVVSAKTHITMEIFLAPMPGTSLRRRAVAGRPATIVTTMT